MKVTPIETERPSAGVSAHRRPATAATTTRRAPRLLLLLLFLTALSGGSKVPEGLPMAGTEARLILGVPLVACFLVWRMVNATALRGGRANPCTQWIVLLWAYHASSALWSAPGAQVRTAVTGDLLLVAMVCIVAASSRVDTAGTRAMILWSMYTAGITYCVASFITGATSGVGRAIAFGGGPNVFARVVLMGLIAAVALSVKLRRPILLLPVPLLLLAGVLSASRGALTAFVATGFVALIVIHRQLNMRSLVLGLASAPALAWIIWTNDRVQLLAERRFDFKTLAASGYSGRETLWPAARSLFLEHPWVGSGIDSFQARMYSVTGLPYPHNLVLEIADDLGIVGLTALGLTGALALAQLRRGTGPVDQAAKALALGAFFIFICGMFSGGVYDSRFAWILLVAALPVIPPRHRASPRAARTVLLDTPQALTR